MSSRRRSGIFALLTSRNAVAAMLGLVLALIPPLVFGYGNLSLIIGALIWCMATYGLFIPYGLTGGMTAAIGVTWGVGAFAAALASSNWGWTFLPCVGLAAVAGGIAAVVLALPMLRTKGQYFVILTFVMASAATVAAGNWSVTSGAFQGGVSVPGYIGLGSWHAIDIVDAYWVVVAVVAVMCAIVATIRRSAFGRLLTSVKENEELARSIGIPTVLLKLVAMGIGGLFAGVGGAFYAFNLHLVTIGEFDFNTAITIILILVLGGTRSSAAPIIGSVVVYFLPGLIGLSPTYQHVAYGVVLALIVIVFPQGLAGVPTRLRRRPPRATAEVRLGRAADMDVVGLR